jgi:hypothetical protein
MAPYSELELRYARPLANAILEDGAFRQWLFAGTKHEVGAREACPIGNIQGSLRKITTDNPYWFNYHTGKGKGIETDILIIFNCANARKLGLHIEIKRPGQRLEEGQAEAYPRRAASWVNPKTRPKTVSPHDDFLTMLVCGQELASDGRLQYFDKVVFHDEVVKRIPGYPEDLASSQPAGPGARGLCR